MEIYGMTGEKLGVIGHIQADKQSDLPQWKKDFLTKPSISVRKGIAWGYSPPFEDTSTLVLTSPKTDFVDIRFPINPDPSRSLASDPAFWAFSGRSFTTFDPDTADVTMPYSAHVVFRHEIDSKGPGITDEGDMFLLPNGDCIEVGIMQNPKSNKSETYKEYWTAPSTDSGSGRLKRSPCVVAKTIAPSSERQGASSLGNGIIIRIGDHCQGLLEKAHQDQKNEILVERWLRAWLESNPILTETHAAGEHAEAQWLKDWRSNTPLQEQVDVFLPCMWLCADGRKLDDEITAKGITWKIVEVA